MSKFKSFEQLIVRKEVGFVCDDTSMVSLSSQGTFDGAVFKLITKCETCLVLLSGHNEVDEFTIDVVVLENLQKGRGSVDDGECLAQAWQMCEAKGYHGLLAIAKVDGSSMPNNGCKSKYPLSQFVNYLIHGMESYFMFQKPSRLFGLNVLDIWQTYKQAMENCFIVMAWKYKEDPTREAPIRSPLIQLNTTSTSIWGDKMKQQPASQTHAAAQSVNKARKRISLQPNTRMRETGIANKKGRLSIQPHVRNDISSEEEDDEIIIKKQPNPVLIAQMSPKKDPVKVEAVAEVQPEDITLGFERSSQQTPGHTTSGGRKSMKQDWREDYKNEILCFFDNLNPKESEQTCIALTCKFALMKYDQELPSKLLYQWIQKKGRTIEKTISCYDLPETDRVNIMIDFFNSLRPEISETSRVAFTCKYMHTQFGIVINSKLFYSMLNKEGKKPTCSKINDKGKKPKKR